MSDFKIETKCIQSGYNPGNGEPRVLPIYQSTTYKYCSSEEVGDLFDLKADGHMYSRISNHTVSAVEEKIAERAAAKKEKNFARADEIRAELLEMGIEIKDTREGVIWNKI